MLLKRVLRSHARIFFFNDTATTEIYTLSLHDALPISSNDESTWVLTTYLVSNAVVLPISGFLVDWLDRKSTRLNSSHQIISYAVFCLKKKKPYHTPPAPAPHACPALPPSRHTTPLPST